MTSPLNSSSPQKDATRYGIVHHSEPSFGKEERFNWQKPRYICDVMYELPEMTMTKSAVFGTATRTGIEVDADTKRRSNGPGSYDVARGFNYHSEYVNQKAYRFAGAPKQSMELKTPSPGAVYNIEHQFYRGPEKFIGVSFGTDKRRPLYNPAPSADADMLLPKLPNTSKAITIARKIHIKDRRVTDSPGPIYPVEKFVNFKTGPSFSFAKGRGSRFSNAQYLPELD